MRTLHIAFSVVVLAISASARANDETPAQCRTRLGSELQCLRNQFYFHQQMCSMEYRIAEMKPDEETLKKAGACGPAAKKATKPFYEALVKKLAKKPAAAAAAKRAMTTFMAMMDDPSRSHALEADLNKAMAEVELEN